MPSATRMRASSAPPDAFGREHRTLHVEDMAATHLARSYRVVWQCELDYVWQTWADYNAADTLTLELAWSAMASEVELEAERPHGRAEFWCISFVSMLQTNMRSGTTRRVRRVLVTNS